MSLVLPCKKNYLYLKNFDTPVFLNIPKFNKNLYL